MSALYIIVALVALQRLAELPLANRNTRRLLAEGGVETGARHYPLFILLHVSWLLAIVLTTPPDAKIRWWALAAFLGMQLGRIWVIATLGRFWTTRIISLPGAPLVNKGPYRFCAHPNYAIVAGEIALLPLAFGNWPVALVWSVLNALLLAWRIRVEDAALMARR